MIPYGYHWRTVTRPAILKRAGGRFKDGRYQGAAKCERSECGWIDCLPNGRSELDIAHLVLLPDVPGHEEHTNLAALCRPCHRAHDYPQWALAFRAWLERERDERRARKDAVRPLLEFLQRGMSAQNAVDQILQGGGTRE